MSTPSFNGPSFSAVSARQKAFTALLAALLAAQPEAQKGMSFRLAETELVNFASERGHIVHVSPNPSEIIKAVLAARIAALATRIPA